MAIPIPPYSLLKKNFPAHGLDAVKKLIGGGADADYIQNACALRISRALNYSGAPLPPGSSDTFVRVKGADGMRYALRMRELRRHLQRTFGPPSLLTKEKSPPSSWQTNKGIIVFEVSGWSNATGHMDLWNGYDCEYHGYWSESFEVALWASVGAGPQHSGAP